MLDKIGGALGLAATIIRIGNDKATTMLAIRSAIACISSSERVFTSSTEMPDELRDSREREKMSNFLLQSGESMLFLLFPGVQLQLSNGESGTSSAIEPRMVMLYCLLARA